MLVLSSSSILFSLLLFIEYPKPSSSTLTLANETSTSPPSSPGIRSRLNARVMKKKKDRGHTWIFRQSRTYNTTVVVASFDFGMTALSIGEYITEGRKFPHLDPKRAAYLTNVYRWIRRQLSLYPDVLSGKFCKLREVWRQRWFHLENQVPKWLRKAFFWIEPKSWDRSEDMEAKFNEKSVRGFNYPLYPPKKFISKEEWSKTLSIFYPGDFSNSF